MSAWQDIATAPKDGTKIVVAEYDYEERRWRFWTDYWREYTFLGGEGFGAPAHPTHWMPLPEPREQQP